MPFSGPAGALPDDTAPHDRKAKKKKNPRKGLTRPFGGRSIQARGSVFTEGKERSGSQEKGSGAVVPGLLPGTCPPCGGAGTSGAVSLRKEVGQDEGILALSLGVHAD